MPTAIALYKAARSEARFLRWAFFTVMGVFFVFGVGSTVESRVFPVILYQSVSGIHKEPDGRLCWDWYFVKTRSAVAIGAYARLYVGDMENPISVGIEHGDGSPFGSNFNGNISAPTSEPWSTRTCIPVPDQVWTAYRLGVQPVITYKDNPVWTVTQYGAWVDYYNAAGHQ